MAVDAVLADLLDVASSRPPDAMPALIADHARDLGASNASIWLADQAQERLVRWPARTPGQQNPPPSGELSIDGTLAGLAYRAVAPQSGDADGAPVTWMPLVYGAERLGVLEIAGVTGDGARDWQAFSVLVAHLVTATSVRSDVVVQARRREEMSLAAEMQWSLLPSLTTATERVVISGLLEPAYEVGGDAFDYAINGDVAHLAVIDAMGHGLASSVLAAVAMGAYRHARRGGGSLRDAYAEMDIAIARQFGPDRFATAQLAQLDLIEGRLSWVNAGHPAPLLVRGHRVVKALESEPTMPLGFGDEQPGRISVATEMLEPGDRLFFFSDGVVEARSKAGEFFGRARLVDFIEREASSELPAPETNRRLTHALLAHQQSQLQDDATLLFVEWRAAAARSLGVGGGRDSQGPAG